MRLAIATGMCALTLLGGWAGPAGAEDGSGASFPNMAPVEKYRWRAGRRRSRREAQRRQFSISDDAEILVLGDRSYETAVKGKNGFVCVVERSWFASFGDPVFWDPTVRGPDCVNRAGGQHGAARQSRENAMGAGGHFQSGDARSKQKRPPPRRNCPRPVP